MYGANAQNVFYAPSVGETKSLQFVIISLIIAKNLVPKNNVQLL